MDEMEFYDGAHTGAELDAGISLIENRAVDEIEAPDNVEDTSVASVSAVATALRDELAMVKATITGTGAFFETITITYPASGGNQRPRISNKHVVLQSWFSNPAAVLSDWTVTTIGYQSGVGTQITISGTINGSTDLTMVLGKIGSVYGGASLDNT